MFLLILDANNLIKRAIMASALDDLKAGEVWTGGVYGAVVSLASFVRRLVAEGSPPSCILAVYDAGVPEFRKAAIPSYKENRKERASLMTEDQAERCFQQVALARQALSLLGCRTVESQGWEADDIIGQLVMEASSQGFTSVIYSSDKDFWQCVRVPHCGIWDAGRSALVDPSSYPELFEEAYKCPSVPVEWYSVFRAIVGDSSDNVPGVPGLGPSWASKAINAVPGIDTVLIDDHAMQIDHLAASLTDATGKKLQTLRDNLEQVHKVVLVNDLLIPRPDLKSTVFTALEPHESTLQRREFLKFCAKLKMRSILGDPDRFVGPFEKVST